MTQPEARVGRAVCARATRDRRLPLRDSPLALVQVGLALAEGDLALAERGLAVFEGGLALFVTCLARLVGPRRRRLALEPTLREGDAFGVGLSFGRSAGEFLGDEGEGAGGLCAGRVCQRRLERRLDDRQVLLRPRLASVD